MSTGNREARSESDKLRTIPITKDLIRKVRSAIEAALVYEEATAGRRKLGITGEVGEILACHKFDLRLVLDSRAAGFDAIDKGGAQVQIKTRRSESEGLPRDAGRTSRFSKHAFEYALLVLLDRKYQLCEVWRASHERLKPLIDKNKRRSPNLASFKRVAEKVFG